MEQCHSSWPPSPDHIPLDFLLWDNVKGQGYSQGVQMLDRLIYGSLQQS